LSQRKDMPTSERSALVVLAALELSLGVEVVAELHSDATKDAGAEMRIVEGRLRWQGRRNATSIRLSRRINPD
jgi:hypothetical protein